MRKGGFKNWLILAGAIFIGAQFSTQIKEFLSKVPVLDKLFNNDQA